MRNKITRLAVIETHPVQYHAPVYRALQQQFDVPVTAVYGSDFSVVGYRDQEFGATFAWDTDLLGGYSKLFLSQIAAGGSQSVETVAARGLVRALRSLDPAAVLLLGYSPRFYQAAVYAAWSGGYPLLFRAETTEHARQRSQVKGRLRDLVLRRLYQRCSALLYIGQRSYNHYRRLGCPEERLVFSPYCVDTSAFTPADADRTRLRCRTRDALGIASDRVVLVFSGKLVQRKRPDLVIRAIRELPSDLRERAVLLVLGDGELRPELEQLAALSPAMPIHFCGFQNQRALSKYYHAADLLVLPSDVGETWGLVVNDALHHGLPGVVSDMVGCAPDLIKPGITGEVFAAGSAADMALALNRAIALTGRTDIRERCREHVANYTVEKAAEGIAVAYHRVLETSARPRPR